MSADVAAPAPVTQSPADLVVDAAASTARFSVRNFGVRRVHGTMRVLGGVVRVDGRGRPLRAEGAVDVSTIRTGNRRRDADLCGGHFLDVAQFCEITLVATRIDEADDGWTTTASLVVRNVPAPVALRVRPLADAPDGCRRFEVDGVLDLRATPIHVPRVLVGRHVEIHVEVVLAARGTGDA